MRSVEFNNILIIKPGAIGDLLQLTPAIRALHEKYPLARISILVGSAATAALFQHNPLVHEAIVFDKRGSHHSLSSLARLWLRLCRARYDLVVNFQRSNLKAWFLASAAFPCRVLVYRKATRRSVHAVINHRETLAPLGILPGVLCLELYPGQEAERYAADFFSANGLDGKTVIAINPGASHPVNRWSTATFAALADLLADRLKARVLIIGGADDEPLAQDIVNRTSSNPLVMTGKTDLLQLGAILKRCNLLVTGDTGPMHIATAVGTKVVALFGAADPLRTGPVGAGHRILQAADVSCLPCRSRTCTNDVQRECMEKITVEMVESAVREILGEKGGEG
ncbi:MAG: glycosyltransferase family 9 protein [Geobacter sp.]|nr:MAG: glycosyltransferase family 9 protein [Geobacter sp.]